MIAGIDLGGTQIKAAAFHRSGELIARKTTPTEDQQDASPPRFAENTRRLLAELEEAAGAKSEAVGISAPGLAARDGRTISHMPGRMRGLENFDWSAWLGRPVPVLNDAHAALLGEVWCGAARGLKDVLMLTLGTGVGGAILSDGRLLRGHIGRAGHFGHLSLDPFAPPTIAGTPGGLEDWIGNHNVGARTGWLYETTHALVDAVRRGDDFATDAWLRSLRGLAAALASLINALDPEVIVIGGGIAMAGDTLFTPLGEMLDAFEWRPAGHHVRILPARLGEWAGCHGAAFSAMNDEWTQPR